MLIIIDKIFFFSFLTFVFKIAILWTVYNPSLISTGRQKNWNDSHKSQKWRKFYAKCLKSCSCICEVSFTLNIMLQLFCDILLVKAVTFPRVH